MEPLKAEKASASKLVIALATGVIIAAFIVRFVLFSIGNTDDQLNSVIDILIFGFLTIRFVAMGVRSFKKRQPVGATFAVIAALC